MAITYVVKVDLINLDDQRFFSTTVEVQSGSPLNLSQIKEGAYDNTQAFLAQGSYEGLEDWMVANPESYNYDYTLIGAFRE